MNNPLQEHAHLFANGKFKVSSKHHRAIMPLDFGQLLYIEQMPVSISDYTLIARPIAGMSDEEMRGLFDTPAFKEGVDYEQIRKRLIKKANNDKLLLKFARVLANNGIYFGPQYHFEDGTVININEI